MLNKRTLVIAAYTVILFLSAPTVLGNAIITGTALLTYLAISGLTLILMDLYDRWRAARVVSQ